VICLAYNNIWRRTTKAPAEEVVLAKMEILEK
jgi:hypothetical protein